MGPDIPNDTLTDDIGPGALAEPSTTSDNVGDARIRGLNKVITQKDNQIKAKDDAIKQLQSQLQQYRETSGSHEVRISELNANYEKAQKQAELLASERDSLNSAKANVEQRLAAATKLIDLGHSDVVPFLLRGNLTVDMSSEDAIKTSVEAFKSDLERLLGTRPTTGITPPRPQAPPANPTNGSGMTFEQLQEWVFDPRNNTKPEYRDRYRDYTAEVAKRNA